MANPSKLVLSGIVLWAVAAAAAAEDAHINSMSYSTQAIYGFDEINVYSSDGQQWDTFSGAPLKFAAWMDVDTRWPGYVASMGVLNGLCVDGACAQNPIIDVDWIVNERDIHWSRVYEIAMSDIPVSTGGSSAPIPLGDEILQACNQHLTANGATVLATFGRSVPTSFSVNTRKALIAGNDNVPPEADYEPTPYGAGDETRQDAFQVQVRCNPYILEGHFVPTPEVEDVELFLATFSNAVTRPDAFRTCKQGRILVRITTEDEGAVAFRLWTDVNGSLEDDLIQTWSAEVGSGVYQAEFERWVSVSETSQLQAMALVENGGIPGLNSGWESLPLECVTGSDQLTDDLPSDVPVRVGRGGLVAP